MKLLAIGISIICILFITYKMVHSVGDALVAIGGTAFGVLIMVTVIKLVMPKRDRQA